ncbi:HAD family hydrolase [Halobacteria archaeon AArc-curdl1]|uniref:HAD family hydrolase n=1 Tax=Natronosalvus hydrolyticus TaxID=2979988 RepID=A0AAP2ZBZ9_9EURY|nr:HAD family hydrolase [Halobacteria archaeon AArc-curdl1]
MTTAVYFDLDGTLCTYTQGFERQFEAAVNPYGEPTERAYAIYVEALFDALDRCAETPYRQAYEAVVEGTSLEADPAVLAREQCQVELEATAVSSETKRVVERVGNSWPTGILTNGDGRQQRAKIDRHGLDELVATVIVSNEIGARKPEPTIFETARERLPAANYVYVGDTYDEDIVGAREAGFRTVYVQGEDGESSEIDVQTTNTVLTNDPANECADAVVPSVESLLNPDALPPGLSRVFEEVVP